MGARERKEEVIIIGRVSQLRNPERLAVDLPGHNKNLNKVTWHSGS